MNLLEEALIKYFGPERLTKIQKTRVGIAGAGGLGSNCALNLVRLGIKRMVIVDYDQVDASNLNRHFYFADQVGKLKVEALRENLLRINLNLELTAIPAKIERTNISDFIKDCQVVVEAFDKAEYKQFFVEHWGKGGIGCCGFRSGGMGKYRCRVKSMGTP